MFIMTVRHRAHRNTPEIMMHYKRKGPKSTRAGCLLCKPHKRQGSLPRSKNMQFGNRRRYETGEAGLRDR